MSTAITVPFHGTSLFIVDFNGEPYTPMRPIVSGMGLAWQSQLEKIKSRFPKGIEEISIPTSGGSQIMLCLALRKLSAWLNTISPNKVRPEIRARVIQYQEECDDVLYEYWTTGEVKRKDEVAPTFIIAPTDQDGKWLLTVRDGRVMFARKLDDGERVISVSSFSEIMERAGNIIIHYTELQCMNPSELVALVDKMEKHHRHWQSIMSVEK